MRSGYGPVHGNGRSELDMGVCEEVLLEGELDVDGHFESFGESVEVSRFSAVKPLRPGTRLTPAQAAKKRHHELFMIRLEERNVYCSQGELCIGFSSSTV